MRWCRKTGLAAGLAALLGCGLALAQGKPPILAPEARPGDKFAPAPAVPPPADKFANPPVIPPAPRAEAPAPPAGGKFAAPPAPVPADEPPALGHDPQGKVLGILGMGGIGRNMKRKCEAFGVETIYHNRTKLSEEMAGGAKWVEFDNLLAKADVLSLNLPLNVSLVCLFV